MKTIFVVDDSDVNLVQAKRTLEGYYHVRTMPSADRMLTIINKIVPDLILLDIEMPEMDGFAAINKLKESEHTANIPVMFLTASTDDDIEAKGLEHGAVDFVTKPFSPAVLLNRIAHHLHIEELLKKRTERLERLQDGILEVVVDMVESRDKITGGHIERTSQYIKILMETMIAEGVYTGDMKDWDLDTVISSARLHDVGKIAVADSILNKPGRLTPEEYDEIKKHAPEGEHIVDRIIAKTGGESFLHHAKLFAGYHHEKWDGTGYPRGQKGEEIPLQGRIMAIADVYDALVSTRPYKLPFTHEEARVIISTDAGKHFDPHIVEVFHQISDRFASVAEGLS
ncbi:MAG: response regulator [Defluviitaleaceae bacterium]|nr:response regulator [Defluviitaleaceae bacterium]